MGQVSTVWAFAVLTACLWFCGGMGFALISILAGLSSGENERGKIFGFLTPTNGLGALIGNLGSGWLVARWGYTTVFNALAICMMVWPLMALLLKEKDARGSSVEKAPAQTLPALGKSFYLLFTASVLASITGFFVLLIRSVILCCGTSGPYSRFMALPWEAPESGTRW